MMHIYFTIKLFFLDLVLVSFPADWKQIAPGMDVIYIKAKNKSIEGDWNVISWPVPNILGVRPRKPAETQ